MVVAYRVLPAWPEADDGYVVPRSPLRPKAVALIRSGMTAAAAGRELGITRERVRQFWIEETGLPVTIHRPTPQHLQPRSCACGGSFRRRGYYAHVRTIQHVEFLFSRKVDRDGPVPEFAPELGPCWMWTGALTVGYAHMQALGEYFGHRVSYRLAKGPIPAGLTLDHLCRVSACVNPDHLEAVTNKENVRRGKNGVLRHLHAPNPRHATCERGHDLAQTRGKNGQCRLCDVIRHKRYAARKRAGLVGQRTAA